MNPTDGGQQLFGKFLKEIEKEASGRRLEIDSVFPNESVPNAPACEVRKEELSDIEYLNSVRDAKLRLEVHVLQMGVQIKQQLLAAKQSECLESEHRRELATEMKDYLRLAHQSAQRQNHELEMVIMAPDTELQQASLQSALENYATQHPAQREINVTMEILRRVKLSNEALTRLMRGEGHATEDEMAAATATVVGEAAGVERELQGLRRQTADMEAGRQFRKS